MSSAGVETVAEFKMARLSVGQAGEAQGLNGAQHGGVGGADAGAERGGGTRQHDLPIFIDEFRHAQAGGAELLIGPPQHAIEVSSGIDGGCDGQRRLSGAWVVNGTRRHMM